MDHATRPASPPPSRPAHPSRSAAIHAPLLGAGVAAAIAASFTRPFTDGADVVVALVLVATVAVLAAQRTLPSPLALLDRPTTPPARGVRGWLPWAIGLALGTAWELTCLFSAPRSSHPTLSSMLDAVDGSHLGRGVAFLAWLALGRWLVTR